MEGHVWRSTRSTGGVAQIENLSDVSHLLFRLLCMNKKENSSCHRAKGTDCPAVSAEASGQQITSPAWDTIHYPLDFLICTSEKCSPSQSPLIPSKMLKQTEAVGGKDVTTEDSDVDWIVCTHCQSNGITLFLFILILWQRPFKYCIFKNYLKIIIIINSFLFPSVIDLTHFLKMSIYCSHETVFHWASVLTCQ